MSLPSRLGRLRRVSRLGAGGFASVWLYRDDVLDSLVAVKGLADNWSQHLDVRERFLEEARILRRADSDHVVRVYDLGETKDGTPYFVMSYADQGTLEDLLAEGRLSWRRAVDLVGQAGQGLSVLHRIGVIHRDVKPPNLLLRTSDDGQARLLVADLGVAKALAQASGLTQMVGTAAYMAPEQAMPGTGVDVRADVHALGAVAYRMVTGQLVREGGLEVVSNPRLPPPPSSLVSGLPRGFDEVIQRAINIDRDARWPDVDSFVAALDDVARRSRRPRARKPLPDPPAVDSDVTQRDAASSSTRRQLAQVFDGQAWPTPKVWFRQRSLLSVALLVLLGVIGTALWRIGVLGPSGPPGSSTGQESELVLELPDPWFESARTTDSVDYRRVVSGFATGLLLRLQDTPLAETPRMAAANELDRVSVGAGFALVSNQALPRSQLAGWASGWAIRYQYVLNDETREQEEWFVGDASKTAGAVSAAGPTSRLSDALSLLPKALAALPQ
jgi:serine/threonine protein kinase